MSKYSAIGRGWPDGIQVEIGHARFDAPPEGKSYRFIHREGDFANGRTIVSKDPRKTKLAKDPKQRIINRLFVQQGGICHYCQKETARHKWSLDHKTPVCRGGTNRRENLVGACTTCNNGKANLTEEEFLPLMRDSHNRKKLIRQKQMELDSQQKPAYSLPHSWGR